MSYGLLRTFFIGQKNVLDTANNANPERLKAEPEGYLTTNEGKGGK